MANNNVQNVRFLRNGNLFTSRTLANNALTGYTLTAEMDGSAILARYQEGGDPIKTLVGFVYFKDASNKSITIFDIDDAGADVDQKINELRTEIEKQLGTGITSANTATAQLAALSGNSSTDTSATTSVEGAKKYAKDYTDSEIGKLDYTGVTTGTGVYIKNVTQTDGIIAAQTESLPTVAAISETGKPITAVSESLGEISATAGTINAEFVNIEDTGSLITATNVEGALAEIAAEIDGMDLAEVSGEGEVITAVSENDGKVSASKTAIKDVKLTGYVKDTTKTGDIAATDDIEDALSKLENKAAAITIDNADGSINVTTGVNGTDIAVNIKSGEHVLAKDGNAGMYTNIAISAVTGTELSNLGTNVKEAYKLVGTDNTKLGEYIKIYKDSSLVNFYLGHVDDVLTDADASGESPTSAVTNGTGDTALVYIMQLANGNYKLAAVNVESFLQEAEFDSGVTVDSGTHVVHGVVDPTSENFLTVGADGFKLAGVQDAINAAVNALDATGGTQTIATDKHVAVEVIEADGKITTVTVVEDNIADADDLTQEISDRQTADTELSNRLGTGVTTANTATAQLTALSGNSSTDTSATTSVEGAKKYADAKLADAVADLDAEVTGGTTAGTATSDHVQVIVSEANGKLTAVTVTETNIADADDLANEIAARKAVDGVAGDAYTADTNANYISGASSLYGADQALDTALKALSDATVNEVQVNGITLAETNNAVNVQVNGATAAATASNGEAIVVTTDQSTGAITLGLASIDCGTY